MFVKCIPPAEQPLFCSFASSLLRGPLLEKNLKLLLTLVVLLRHTEVAQKYPDCAVVRNCLSRAHEAGVSNEMLTRWMLVVRKSWLEENTMALSLEQVSNFVFLWNGFCLFLWNKLVEVLFHRYGILFQRYKTK